MYRKRNRDQLTFVNDFFLPFGGKLRADNRWVKLSQIIPWDLIEDRYAELFPAKNGNPAKPVRMALGALIIKEKCGYSDEETVAQISENPYLQYFIGLEEFKSEPPFDPSLMVHFRKRLGLKTINEINELICRAQDGAQPANGKSKTQQHPDDTLPPQSPTQGVSGESDQQGGQEASREDDGERKGKLILDATCAPADIHYPTDLSLLNEAREKLEKIIDVLYEPFRGKMAKPRTYRRNARRDYLHVAKQRKVTHKQIRKAVGKQLRYVARDLRTIAKLAEKHGNLNLLSKRQARELWVISELYRQQSLMFKRKECRIDDRIVSISQPHVRPIVRGKAHAETEFGAKVAISLVNGRAFLDELSWDNFNEGSCLKEAVEAYRQRYGHYPEAVLADKLYRTRENLKYCKALGIRLSGPRLGRPPKANAEQRRLERQDARERSEVEGKFGEGKRCYGLGRIMARLQETSETVIALQFLVMNLGDVLRDLFCQIFKVLFSCFGVRIWGCCLTGILFSNP